jgi:anaerobic magnesium-protoporphyrin IX monomethyl ester cyclase
MALPQIFGPADETLVSVAINEAKQVCALFKLTALSSCQPDGAISMPLSIACVYSVESYVSLEKPIRDGASIPFGLATIASVLKNAGHEVELLVFTPDTPISETLRPFLQRFRPRLFCLTAVSTQFPLIRTIAEAIKQLDPSIYVALGGAHASLMPEEAIACPFIDAVCVGEGDTAIVELAAQILEGRQPTDIHNFWFKPSGSNTIVKNAPAPFLSDLDSLPFIDRELWRSWIQEPDRDPSVLVGRGCPFRCSYCSNHILGKLAKGSYVRFRSHNHIIKEIEQITRDPKVTNVYLEVETIGVNLKYALQLCQALSRFNDRRNTPIQFKINLAVTHKLVQDINLINSLLEAFKRANIVTINIGLESGSERIRNEVLRRPRYSNEDILTFCACAIKYDIKIILFVMIGLPGESIADFNETFHIVRLCEPHNIWLSIYYPYPGTDLYRVAKEGKLFSENNISNVLERRRSYLNLPDFPRWKIMKEYILFKFKVYKGRKSFQQRIFYAIRAAMETNKKIDNIYLYLSRQTKIGQFLFKRYRIDF